MLAQRQRTIEKEIVRIISKKKVIRPSRLRPSSNLSHEFGFDTGDLVDIILELEKNFKIVIPDEVPIHTVGDFVVYVTKQTLAKGQS
jgi:acyl carrier protein